jgi:hypothetical protein
MRMRIPVMRGMLAALLLPVLTVYAQLGRGPQGPRVVSPEIHSDKKVTFRLLAPKADAVVLNGNWDMGTNIP